jgi:uncharacterized protein
LVEVNIRTQLPRDVRTIEHLWIPLRDGCRLAARVWLPSDAEEHPVPVIMEYIPYRKNEGTAVSDALRHPYFAGHGYASVRVDLRGSGDSEGLLLDEYLLQEQEDALDVLAWLEQQPWCTGAVGMMGYSWGGFNSLQVAARRPPQLKAIITVHSTDDRYAGDCHYMGGCVSAYDMLSWATTMFAYNGRPPDPTIAGDDWRVRWRERLEATPPLVQTWLSHQLYDDYWKHGSVCEDYDAIGCPVLTVGGWADPYHDTVLRLLGKLRVPCRGLIGPWAHGYPDEAVPGPQIGFNQECLRWWDQWLKGVDTGIMDEPLLRAFILDHAEPAPSYCERSGRWVAEGTWPSERAARTYFFGPRTLECALTEANPITLRGTETAGQTAGTWCPYKGATDLPPDQRLDDALSLVFDSDPIVQPLEVLGFPEVTMEVCVDKPLALVVVRLCDVSPTGSSALVSRGLLNLAHRESREQPSTLEPGKHYEVHLPLVSVGYRFPEGHRLRLAISPTYWPWLWPSPETVTLTVFPGSSRLELPARTPQSERSVAFSPVEVTPPVEIETISASEGRRIVTWDVGAQRLELVVEPDHLPGRVRLVATERLLGEMGTNTYSIVEGDSLSASVRCERTVEVGGPGWHTATEVDSTMTCTRDAFSLETSLRALDGEALFFERTWSVTIPRVLG